MKHRPALTLVELVLTISIIAIISATGIYLSAGARQKYALKLSTDNLVSELQRVHIFARENKEEKSWGIRIVDGKNYLMVSREPAGETIKYQFSLAEPVRFSTDPMEIWFDQVTGNTENNISLGLISPRGDVKTINISQYGLITSQ